MRPELLMKSNFVKRKTSNVNSVRELTFDA
jgi:hypothetical protein